MFILSLHINEIDSINLSISDKQTIDIIRIMIQYNSNKAIDGQLKDLLSKLGTGSNEDIDNSTGEAICVRK